MSLARRYFSRSAVCELGGAELHLPFLCIGTEHVGDTRETQRAEGRNSPLLLTHVVSELLTRFLGVK